MEKKPIHELKWGPIKAAIWEGKCNGGSRYVVIASRPHKSDHGWIGTCSLRREDFMVTCKVIDEAYRWIWKRQTSLQEGSHEIQDLAESKGREQSTMISRAVEMVMTLGDVHGAPEIRQRLTREDVDEANLSHETTNWLGVCPADAQSEEEPTVGLSAVSFHVDSGGTPFCIVTEVHHSGIYVLMPNAA